MLGQVAVATLEALLLLLVSLLACALCCLVLSSLILLKLPVYEP